MGYLLVVKALFKGEKRISEGSGVCNGPCLAGGVVTTRNFIQLWGFGLFCLFLEGSAMEVPVHLRRKAGRLCRCSLDRLFLCDSPILLRGCGGTRDILGAGQSRPPEALYHPKGDRSGGPVTAVRKPVLADGDDGGIQPHTSEGMWRDPRYSRCGAVPSTRSALPCGEMGAGIRDRR